MKNLHKKLSNEDKFARKFYCNAHRFISKMKKVNNKKVRRKLKESEDD